MNIIRYFHLRNQGFTEQSAEALSAGGDRTNLFVAVGVMLWLLADSIGGVL